MNTQAVAVEAEEEDPPAGRVRISFELLASALKLPDGFQVIGILAAPGAEVELIIAGPGIPEVAAGDPLPVIGFTYELDRDDPQPRVIAKLRT